MLADTNVPACERCGHAFKQNPPSAERQFGAGSVVLWRDASDRTLRICQGCAYAVELADALADTPQPTYAYLSSDAAYVTTWPGLPLLQVTHLVTRKGGAFGRRFGQRLYVTAQDGHGRIWHGVAPDRGMAFKVRPAKSAQSA